MTQTEAPGSAKATPRQRRIDEQRGKIEESRRRQRQQRLTRGLLVVVPVLALLVIAAIFLLPRPVPASGHPVPIEGNRNHLPQGSAIQYTNRPPSSGDHYDSPAKYGVSASPAATGNWVHTLEHGGIVVLYRPDLCDQACVSVLSQAYNDAPNSQMFQGVKKMVVQPYQDMDHAIAVVAWGWLDEMDVADKDRVVAFYRAHVDRGPEAAL